MTDRRARPARRLCALALSGACLSLMAGLVTGCGDADRSPVDQAAAKLTAMGGEAPTDEAVKGFNQTKSEVRGISGGSPVTQAGASVLAGEADAGLGAVYLAQAQDASARASREARRILASLEARAAIEREASSLEAYDAGPQTEQVQSLIDEREAQIAQGVQREREVAARLADLEARAGEQMQKAEAERQSESELRRQASDTSLSATARAGLIEQAAEFRRVATGFETRGSLLQAEADAMRPQLAEAERDLERLRAQLELLEGELSEVGRRVSARRAAAARHRAASAELVASLTREGGPVPAMVASVDEAASKWKAARDAFASARRASSGARALGRNAPSVTETATRGELDATNALATTLAAHADVLERALGAGLQAPDLSQKLDEWRSSVTDASRAVDELAAQVEPVESVPVAPAGGVEDAARVALMDLIEAVRAGDAATLKASLTGDDEALLRRAEGVMETLASISRLNNACRSELGNDVLSVMLQGDPSDPASQAMTQMMAPMFDAMRQTFRDRADPANWSIVREDDARVRVTFVPPSGDAIPPEIAAMMDGQADTGPSEFEMVLQDGAWLVKVDASTFEGDDSDPGEAAQMAQAFNDLAQKIESGEITSGKELIQALQTLGPGM